jgi:hypothetical protein
MDAPAEQRQAHNLHVLALSLKRVGVHAFLVTAQLAHNAPLGRWLLDVDVLLALRRRRSHWRPKPSLTKGIGAVVEELHILPHVLIDDVSLHGLPMS